GPLSGCTTSLDSSEALVGAYSPLIGSASWTTASASGLGGTVFPNFPLSVVVSQSATVAPFGGPVANEWDIFSTPRFGSTQFLFKVWGEAAINQKPFPFVPVSTGGLGNIRTRQTDANAALLIMYTQSPD